MQNVNKLMSWLEASKRALEVSLALGIRERVDERIENGRGLGEYGRQRCGERRDVGVNVGAEVSDEHNDCVGKPRQAKEAHEYEHCFGGLKFATNHECPQIHRHHHRGRSPSRVCVQASGSRTTFIPGDRVIRRIG